MKSLFPWKRIEKKIREIWYIVARNVFLLTNGIIALVVFLLFFFGDIQSGLFLGFILVINITLGLGQDMRAWYALQKLQLLTAPRVLRMSSDGSTEFVLTEEIQKGDKLALKTGDEIPCDGTLIESSALESNEGLLTGESTSFPHQSGDHLLAGSIVTAGSGLFVTDTIFEDSRISRMTEGIKDYSVNESPIQKGVNQIVSYAGYVLIAVIFFVVIRGFVTGTSHLIVIKNVGALASALVPQGLVFAMTLLFAYGAAHLYRRNVLLQEVNATEKLGRIKNLCMDKTGTLTENRPTVEKMEMPTGATREQAIACMLSYLDLSGDTSQTMIALREYVGNQETSGTLVARTPFSSWHPYGAIEILESNGETNILVVGSGEHLVPSIGRASEREWFAALEKREVVLGKRIVCLMRAEGGHLSKDISSTPLSFVAVFVLSSKLRPGIEKAIRFFQDRGVRIRIISGDHPETVRTVAKMAGVKYLDQVVTGMEMKSWTAEDFSDRARNYSIFARISPEQKEKIIEALKKDGFTAMVGDGANDALAIKKADLGIAMFEGAPATRRLASVVLMNNSFSALPGGVELADSIIKNAEIFASLFFGSALSGLFFFFGVSLLGFPFPLTPLNITFVNYFTVGFPGLLVSYWTIRKVERVLVPSTGNFLRKIGIFVFWSALLQSLILLGIFFLSPENMKSGESNLWVVLAWSVIGYIFFLFTPALYRGSLLLTQRRDMILLTVFEILFLALIFSVPFLLRFFEISGVSPYGYAFVFPSILLGVYIISQWSIVFFVRKYASALSHKKISKDEEF